MMHLFLVENRAELERRCREKVAMRSMRLPSEHQLQHGVPIFLDQLIRTLKAEDAGKMALSLAISGPADGSAHGTSELADSATTHGGQLLALGYSISQVVHGYGDLCQAVSDLAVVMDEQFAVEEFRTLNRCLDNGIAEAVSEFTQRRDVLIANEQALALSQRIGYFAHELRNQLGTASLAVSALKQGGMGLAGATGAVLDRSLVSLRTLIDRSLAEVRVEAGLTLQRSVFSLNNFITEVSYSASLEADLLRCTLVVEEVAPLLQLHADQDLLLSAVGNLLQNAFKFGALNGTVVLRAYASGGRLKIEVEDNGAGLPPEAADDMFLPFTQAGANKTGLGLGLSIARRSVEANGGNLSVESVVGHGCVFIIDLPRHVDSAATFAA
ncbi:sensor histidine kinase [Janthinobacterium sp. EB271-G4-7A]|uniref:sensor histidine kinase n=1 Tax=Janthinobacterium sp. EB271-G4-7A TaxID=2775056 RepID=UPI001E475916|nr:HAMP domain-containing sensor histidine kinase [Janthinobacterium sp. EB271-G4-7A]MCC7697318.1 HAMP domain-containing histidine kinase [Janthinobacterium sp. EB271-G4-7A]